MLADVLSAEGFKLARNRLTAFFAFLFLPAAALVMTLVGELWLSGAMQPRDGAPLPDIPFDFSQALTTSIQYASNPLIILFCLIGAATLFGGEYRWETWRLILPRARRLTQLSAKIIVYLGASGLSLLLTSLAIFAAGLIVAIVKDRTLVGAIDGDEAMTALASFGIGWLRLIQAGALAALAGVLTRSIMAALLVPLGIGIAQGILQAITTNGVPPSGMEAWQPLAMPALAGDLLAGALQSVDFSGLGVPEGMVQLSLLSFVIWIGVGFGGAMLLFLRQDLSKE